MFCPGSVMQNLTVTKENGKYTFFYLGNYAMRKVNVMFNCKIMNYYVFLSASLLITYL